MGRLKKGFEESLTLQSPFDMFGGNCAFVPDILPISAELENIKIMVAMVAIVKRMRRAMVSLEVGGGEITGSAGQALVSG